MALALLLMPLGICAQDNIITPVLKFVDPNIQASMEEVTTWTMGWSTRNGVYPELHNPNQLSGIVYTSSNTGVATIDDKGTITPVAIGSTTITASFTGNGIFESAYASYMLTYTDDRNTVEDLGFGFSSSTAEVTYGDASVNIPSLNMGKLAGAAITYSSSATGVATVDASGQVTIVGAGQTVITASFAGNDNTKPGSVSYTLTVGKKEVGLEWGTTTFTYDGSAHVPTATATGLVGNDQCTVTVDGAQTNAGSYTATASALSNANYKLPAANTMTFTIGKADATVTFASKSADAKIGQAFTSQTATTSPAGLSLTYASSVPTVATVDATTGTVTLVATGSTTITATFGGNNNYNSASDSYTLTVSKADPVDAGISFSSASATATYGDATVTPPTLNNPNKLSLTWSSSNQKVATVSTNGTVTIVSVGETEISAGFVGNDSFLPATVSYTLTVGKKEVGLEWGTTTFTYDGSAHVPTATATGLVGNDQCTVTVDGAQTNAGSYTATASALSNANYKLPAANTMTFTIGKADATVTFASKSADAKIGQAFTSQTATTSPAGLSLTYASSVPTVATVDATTGTVTLVATGSTTITAAFGGNNNYNSASDSYILTVSKADAVEVELSFASKTVTVTYGDATATPPALSNPLQLPLTWSSSNVNVATIDTDNSIRVVGVGQTVISATFAGNDEYQGKTASFTLTVNKAPVTVSFATKWETVTLGDDFTSPKATTNPPDLQLVYSTSDKRIAKINANTGDVTLKGAGTVRIAATFLGSDNYESGSAYYDLTVLEPTPTLEPIVKEMDYPMDDEYFVNADGSEIDLSNTIINNILYTLKNQNSPEGDGYDTGEHCIVINTVTPSSTVNALLKSGLEPGSTEYASQFTGMTFLVPQGEGYVIITSQEAESVYLMVKIGVNDPIAINMPEMGDYSIPYKSDEPSYVYMWKGDSNVTSGTRGKKEALDVRVRKVSYKSKSFNGILQVNNDAADDLPWYDLNGQRIMRPLKKGVYIHGNRKVVIK
jgi:uncharacterized protein YjdB